MTTFDWKAGTPMEVIDAAGPLLGEYEFLVPTWCHRLDLSFAPELPNAAESSSQPEYRTAHIVFGGHFVDSDDDYRRETVVHDLLHLPLHPLTQWWQERLNDLVEDETLRRTLQDAWSERYEGAVCDLERAVLARPTDG